MRDNAQDPPATLAEAETRFRGFLGENRFPPDVRWILSDQIALTTERSYLIRAEGADDGRREAERRYSVGLKRGLGVCLNAICVADGITIASVYVPTDQLDANRHLMGPILKLSCPTDRLPASIINDPVEWDALGYDIQARSKTMREGLEL